MHPRYRHVAAVGMGGQGIVHAVHDSELGRDVALKTLRVHARSAWDAEGFRDEARAAASLEHPGIVPVYDVGSLTDGRPYYTMRLVSGSTLARVLRELEAAIAAAATDWSVIRLVQVVQQACLALQFAHDRGILHRDVKPANILLGSLGEVLLVDWGIARSLRTPGGDSDWAGLSGTLAYMSPEQARGKPLDARADVYSLGVVLYEMLSLRLPHRATSEADLLAGILRDDPQPLVMDWSDRRIPEALVDIVTRALAKDPDARHESARALHDALQTFIEGVLDSERRRQAARSLAAEGDSVLAQHARQLAEAEALQEEIARLEIAHEPGLPIREKMPLILARRRLREVEATSRLSFLEALNRFTDALAHDPGDDAVQAKLAAIAWTQLQRAEHQMHDAEADTWRVVLRRFGESRYSRELAGVGCLDLQVRPADAECWLHPLVETDLVLADGPGRYLGRGRVVVEHLPMGSYVVVARAPGHEPARMPIHVTRCAHVVGELELLPAGSLPAGHVHVPRTTAWLGGDDRAANTWPLRQLTIETFAIARDPVSCGEYAAFLDAIDPDAARRHVPRTATEGDYFVRVDGRHVPNPENYPTWIARRHGVRWPFLVPVTAVDAESAAAFASWKTGRDGRPFRLPTAAEWELAARGVDRRFHPWGDIYDPALCWTRESASGEPEIQPIGTAASDVSVYGVRDMAGGVQELTGSWFDEPRRVVELRGSGWAGAAAATRCCWRAPVAATARNPGTGFRLVAEVRDA